MIEAPFVFGQLISEWIGTPRKQIFLGGPGMGKTRTLLELEQKLKSRSRPTTLVRTGTDSRSSITEIVDWLESPRGTLLIDDLDRVYDFDLERAFRDHAGDKRDVNIVATSATPIRSRDLQAAPGLNERRASNQVNPIIFESKGLTAFSSDWLNPWSVHWQTIAAARCLEGLQHQSQSGELLEPIAALVTQTTGGHPSLLHFALDEADRWFSVQERRAFSPEMQNELQTRLEESLMDAGEPLVRRALNWVERQASPAEYRSLREVVAAYPKGVLHPLARLLQAGGLGRSELGTTTIPCKVLATLMQLQLMVPGGPRPTATADSTIEVVKARLIMDPLDHDAVAGISWVVGGRPGNMKLSRNDALVISVLVGASGEPVTVQAISEQTGLTVRSVRSTILQLNKEFKLLEMPTVLTNVPRKGYRLNIAT